MSPPTKGPTHRWFLVAIVFVSGSCVFGSTSSPQTTGTPSGTSSAAGCRLQVDPEASGQRGNLFTAADGSGPHDVWAVGTHFEVSRSGPLVTHWDGSSWSTSMQGGQRFHGLQLTDVRSLSVDDVWAVGFSYGGANSIHWDGTGWTEHHGDESHWGGTFLGLDAISPTDLWAVGKEPMRGGYDTPIIEHWAGSSWTSVPAPVPSGWAAGLHDVSAAGPDSIWAVGWSVDASKVFRPLVERWNGTAWSIVRIPRPNSDALLSGVAAKGPDDVWAVGWSWTGDETSPLTLHWDGRSWSRVTSLETIRPTGEFSSVEVSGDRVAIVGQAPDDHGIQQPVALSRAGTSWTDQATPSGQWNAGFQGVMLIGTTGMLAVGNELGQDGYASLIQKGC
jgi:hypothetical protein